jgi:putative membrane protein
MSLDWLKPAVVLGSVLYAVIGVVVLWASFVIIDKLTPYKLWEEIVEHKNVALGVVVAGMFIAIGQIVAAAIHG